MNPFRQIVLKVLVRYYKQPGILVIKQKVSFKLNFTLIQVGRNKILKEIKILNKLKATQDADIPTKIIKEKSDILVSFLFLISLFQDITNIPSKFNTYSFNVLFVIIDIEFVS